MTTPFENPKQRRSLRLWSSLRANFLTGLIVIAPIGLTAWLIWSVVGWIDGLVLPFIPDGYTPDVMLRRALDPWVRETLGLAPAEQAGVVPTSIRGIGVVVFVVVTVLVGWLAKGLIGRSLLRGAEALVVSIPVVRSIYSGVKQIAETVLSDVDTSFDKACLIEYPRKGIWAIAFISTQTRGEVRDKVPDSDMLSVFVPTTPNPTSGFLLFFPREDVIELDMSVEQAAKLVISAGLVYPGKDEDKAIANLPPGEKPPSPGG